MREIIEIYTKSKTFNNISEIMKEVNRIRTKVDATSFEEMARYVCEEPNGKKYSCGTSSINKMVQIQ